MAIFTSSNQVTFIETADGFPIAIEHFSCRTERPDSLPVVLCPGFGGNRFNVDLDEQHSLARYLANEGLDVWVAELRGQGRSKGVFGNGRTQSVWNMDDHVEQDIPAILDTVTRLSGQSRLFWVGHSLGGMVSYCLLAHYPEFAKFFAGIVTIGSPGRVKAKGALWLGAANPLLQIFARRGTLPTSTLIRLLFSPLARRLRLRRLWRYWLNPQNMDQAVIDATMRSGVEDWSCGTLQQWLTSMRRQSLLSADGAYDYFQHMDHIDVPILIIGGTADPFAPHSSLADVFNQVRSIDKKMRIFGRNGFEMDGASLQTQLSDKADYGHDDLLLGEASPSEVFPYITVWLKSRCEIRER